LKGGGKKDERQSSRDNARGVKGGFQGSFGYRTCAEDLGNQDSLPYLEPRSLTKGIWSPGCKREKLVRSLSSNGAVRYVPDESRIKYISKNCSEKPKKRGGTREGRLSDPLQEACQDWGRDGDVTVRPCKIDGPKNSSEVKVRLGKGKGPNPGAS